MPSRVVRQLALCFALALISACASAPVADTKGAEFYFKQGEAAYAAHHFEDAIASWKKVREAYTSPELTAQAELRIADTQFQDKAYIEAAAAYDDFLKLHPGHEKAPYALYRLALSHYQQIAGIDTDQTPVKNAVLALETFLNRYPGSPEAAEVRLKLADCRAKQLEYENYVGNFYLRTGKYPSAIKRLNEALAKFPNNPKLDQTLFLLAKAYLKSGDKVQGEQTLKRLAAEFPASPLNREAGK